MLNIDHINCKRRECINYKECTFINICGVRLFTPELDVKPNGSIYCKGYKEKPRCEHNFIYSHLDKSKIDSSLHFQKYCTKCGYFAFNHKKDS